MTVRTLMLIVLAVGGGVGWVGYRARVERDAFEAVTRMRGRVYFDWQWTHGVPRSSAQPGWLTRHLGPGYFEHIVSIVGPDFNDEVLAQIGRLDRVEWLITYPSTVTDVGMGHLRGLTGLRRLQIASGRATGASLANLAGMTRLESLRLYMIPVSCPDLVHLAGLSQLEDLCIESPQITDACVAPLLSGRLKLRALGLSGSGISDAGAEELSHHKTLQTLYLGNTRVSDAGLASLTKLPLLKVLHLDGTQVTDVGLAQLKGLTGLQDLSLDGTKVTDAGLAHLRGLTGLRRLSLGKISVNDTGLEHLKSLVGLEQLDLRDAFISDSGLRELQQARRKAVILR
jgi:hypothetical protein